MRIARETGASFRAACWGALILVSACTQPGGPSSQVDATQAGGQGSTGSATGSTQSTGSDQGTDVVTGKLDKAERLLGNRTGTNFLSSIGAAYGLSASALNTGTISTRFAAYRTALSADGSMTTSAAMARGVLDVVGEACIRFRTDETLRDPPQRLAYSVLNFSKGFYTGSGTSKTPNVRDGLVNTIVRNLLFRAAGVEPTDAEVAALKASYSPVALHFISTAGGETSAVPVQKTMDYLCTIAGASALSLQAY